jgi:hypothetical protein
VLAHRLEMRPSCDESHVRAGAREPPAEESSDTPRAHHCDPHVCNLLETVKTTMALRSGRLEMAPALELTGARGT